MPDPVCRPIWPKSPARPAHSPASQPCPSHAVADGCVGCGRAARGTGHAPGRVAVDLAVMLADGGETITDLAVLRDQREVFGPVAATPTAREIAWLQAADTRDGIPASRAGGRDLPCLVLDLDATLVTCHSEKEQAAAAYKRGFGYHPLLCFLHHIRALPDRVSGTRPWNRTDPCATEQRPPS
ncbi:hypothetical protein QF027_004139 [Streptomyces canus]|nr:hypothetical protein [Streptomyces canus]